MTVGGRSPFTAQEDPMVKAGDRVQIKSRSGPRAGIVINVSGSMLRLRWDNGEETTIVPGPGVLSILTGPTGRTSTRSGFEARWREEDSGYERAGETTASSQGNQEGEGRRRTADGWKDQARQEQGQRRKEEGQVGRLSTRLGGER